MVKRTDDQTTSRGVSLLGFRAVSSDIATWRGEGTFQKNAKLRRVSAFRPTCGQLGQCYGEETGNVQREIGENDWEACKKIIKTMVLRCVELTSVPRG
jgi:hypothetical protein